MEICTCLYIGQQRETGLSVFNGTLESRGGDFQPSQLLDLTLHQPNQSALERELGWNDPRLSPGDSCMHTQDPKKGDFKDIRWQK